jgi:hypothetical protein
MRCLACFCLLLVFSTAAHSQKTYRALGAYTSFFNSGQNITVMAGIGSNNPQYTVNRALIGGVEYTMGLSRVFKLSFALEYADRSITSKGYYMDSTFGIPKPLYTTGTVQFLSVPVNIRLDFWKYFFFTSGITIDLELKNNIMNNQSGIGASGGLGLKYDFAKKPLTIIFHPYYQTHNIIPFHAYDTHHFLVAGIRTGLIYRFR